LKSTSQEDFCFPDPRVTLDEMDVGVHTAQSILNRITQGNSDRFYRGVGMGMVQSPDFTAFHGDLLKQSFPMITGGFLSAISPPKKRANPNGICPSFSLCRAPLIPPAGKCL
jgi:hypothetical protein